jgi:prepilin-type N-terminal cleavage/methylation domain-containing protein
MGLSRRPQRLASGFTLVELLVVIAIIGVLVALLLPAVQAAREAGRRAACQNQIKQLAIACHSYESSYKHFPANMCGTGAITDSGGTHRLSLSGWVALLPYCEQQDLYDRIYADPVQPWIDDTTHLWTKTILPHLSCPSDAGDIDTNGKVTFGRTSYGMCTGDDYAASESSTTERTTPSEGQQRKPINHRGIFGRLVFCGLGDITDGSSNTVLLGERSRPSSFNDRGAAALDLTANPATYRPISCRAQFVRNNYISTNVIYKDDNAPGYRWGDGKCYFTAVSTILPPNSAVCVFAPPSSVSAHLSYGIWTANSDHPSGVMVTMADGSTRFITNNIDCGDSSAIAPAANATGYSPYGVWGALGTKSAGENVSY